MTEREWDRCSSPRQMLAEVADRTTLRKLRLFAVACCRRVEHRMHEGYARRAVEAALAAADGRLNPEEHREALLRARAEGEGLGGLAEAAALNALDVVRAIHVSWPLVEKVAVRTAETAVAAVVWPGAERAAQARLVRDVFGYPTRAVSVRPEWLAGGAVRPVAEAVYAEEAFDGLPILADALEEAGCADTELLGHLRGPGPHVRGCWALDAVLGRD